MGLREYIKKRDFNKTSEPKTGKSQEKELLRFVIQQHAASHLHYDFRLEMEGVLKSWAVPKGPSLDPEIKRLAMMVEDHPYDYRTFEGIIPKGQYGGGTVIVWDEGTYEPAEMPGVGKKEQEKRLLHELHAGKLKFLLHGKKLQGEFALVKAYGRGENGWLLMKLQDAYASKDDVTRLDKSVQSGLDLEAVATTSDKIWNSNKQGQKEPNSVPIEKPQPLVDVKVLLKKGKKSEMPRDIPPMLATLVDQAFDDPAWAYEIKWDGYRTLAYLQKGQVELSSRNNKSFNEKFYPLYEILKKWDLDMVLDGEIVVLDQKGMSDFSSLQSWRSEADGQLVYYVFDLLWYQGRNVMELPFRERRILLQNVLPKQEDTIRLSQVFENNGLEFFDAAKQMGFEGIIAKQQEGSYQPDVRSKDWLKIKTDKRQEAVIGGFTHNEDSLKKFSALLMGVYEKGKLHYIGQVGTGYTDKLQEEIMAKLTPYVTDTCPFSSVPELNKPSRFRPKPPKASVTWVRPMLVGEVSFREMTKEGVMRHPSFKGLREDKPAHQVQMEVAKPMDKVVEKEESSTPTANLFQAPKNSGKKTLLNPSEESQTRVIEGHTLKFSHLSKLYWPEDKVSKRDLLNYYYQIAPYMVPHLVDRPQSLHRFPDGIHGLRFYQKNVEGKAPDWIETYSYVSEGEKKEMLVCCNEASLLYMASLGCIEINPFFSRKQSVEYPDYCVIDLDPDKNTFDQVIETALVTKKVLDSLGVPCYCKTSGSTGMHIYIPLGGQYTYDQSQLFAKLIVTIVHQQVPYTTLERMVANRKGKMYLDFLQNRPGATIAGVYSLRPKPGATVSMPLHWEEVKPGLKMQDFTIFNAIDRVRREGDLFSGVLGKGIDLLQTIQKAQSVFEA